jgi:hypothetical protein
MLNTYEIHELAYEAEEELERSSTARAKCVLISEVYSAEEGR